MKSLRMCLHIQKKRRGKNRLEWYILGIILFATLIMFLLSGMPVGFGLGLSAIVGFLTLVGPEPITNIAFHAWHYGTSWSLLSLPLFILMAEIIVFSGLGASAFSTAKKVFGRIPGSLGIATIWACAGFAAACGTSVACAIAVGKVSVPEMIKHGYGKRISVGATAAGGSLGILIPPSLIMIIYGTLTEQSIGKLFVAGLIPGIVAALILSIYISITAILRPDVIAPAVRVPWKERLSSIKNIGGLVVLITIVFGTLYGGVCTPTEVASLGAVGAIAVAFFSRKLNWLNFKESLMSAVQTTSFVVFIIIGASSFASLVSYLGITDQLTSFMISLSLPPLVLLIGVYMMYIVLGTILDPTGMMVLTLPFIFPIILKLGFDPIWFGVVITLLCEIAYITPPFGFNLFVLKSISPADVTMGDVIRGCAPFIILLFIVIALLTAFPGIALWLPSTMN